MKTNENGRSMIEMLGVLAIIGVLSVGGIYGYTLAMRKYKANEVVQAASMMATMVKAGNGGLGITSDTTPAALGLATKVGGVDISAMTAAAGSTYDAKAVVKLGTAIYGTSGSETELGKAICSIAPKGDAATAAGYYINECGS